MSPNACGGVKIVTLSILLDAEEDEELRDLVLALKVDFLFSPKKRSALCFKLKPRAGLDLLAEVTHESPASVEEAVVESGDVERKAGSVESNGEISSSMWLIEWE